MASDSTTDSSQPAASGHAFWWRVSANFFRRWWLFVLPVVVIGAFGVIQARDTGPAYRSSATLSVSTNPLVPEQQVRPAEASLWETMAAATSRSINEQLGTDAFLSEVTDASGLSEAIEAGVLDRDIVRSNVWSSGSGNSLVRVYATWGDPATSRQLVVATIDAYLQYVADTVASAATSAEEFWTDRRAELVADRDAAEAALNTYISDLPTIAEGADYPVTVEVELNRLAARLDALEADISDVDEQIDNALLTKEQQTASAGTSFTMVDPPTLPNAPESTLARQAMTIVAFALMGVVIAFGALLVTSSLDRSISSPVEIAAIDGVSQVVTVAPLRRRRRRRRSSRRAPNRRATQEAA